MVLAQSINIAHFTVSGSQKEAGGSCSGQTR